MVKEAHGTLRLGGHQGRGAEMDFFLQSRVFLKVVFFLLISRICRKLSHYSLHPGKLTWNLKMDPWKRRFLLETIIFRFHVSFRGGTPILCWFVESVVVKPEHGKLNNHGSRPFFWNDLTGQMSNEKRAPGLFGFIVW